MTYVDRVNSGPMVVVEEVPGARSIRMGFFVRAGSVYENKKINGISHFIEHTVFKGTKNRTAKKISEEIESRGGYIDAYTTSEHTGFLVHILPEDLETAIDLLSDLLFHPLFREEDIQKERNVILEEVKGYFDSPEHVLFQKTYERLFGKDSSLALPIEGTTESVRKISREDILDYWKRFYYPENIIISAAGKVDRENLLSLLEKKLPHLAPREPAVPPSDKPFKNSATVEIFSRRGLKHVYVTLSGTLFPYTDDKNKYPFLILNTYLSSGMSSFLFQKFREENPLVYTISTFASLHTHTGEWGIFFSTDRKNLNKVLSILKDSLNNLRLTEEEVKIVKKKLKGALTIELEKLGNKVSRNFKEIFYYKKYRTPEEVLQNIMNVNTEQVNDAVSRFINTETLILTILGGVKHVEW